MPNIPGLETFKGTWYHTGQWPHEGVNFTGKRVGMIGTGSTGIQAAPVIASTAAHLTVFQRTANYCVPARNVPLTPEFKRWIKENTADIRAPTHETHNGLPFRIDTRKALETPAEEREKIYEAAWERGGLQFRAVFEDHDGQQGGERHRRRLHPQQDPLRSSRIRQTAAILSDIDHPYAAKRPPIDTDYFETFNRENVSLVNVKAEPIHSITPEGIRTAERRISR